MSNTPVRPPAGWYPAPDGSSATWWWDGAQWAQPLNQPAYQPAMVNAIGKLATATKALLIVVGVFSLATIGVEAFGIAAASSYLNGDDVAADVFDSYDQISSVIALLNVPALIATAVLWFSWQYKAAKLATGLTRRSPGWHVGSWFVPFVSLWFPYENISDLWRANGRSRPSWLIVWWLLWVVSNAITWISSRISMDAEVVEQYRDAMWVSVAGQILLLAAAPFAWLVIRGITQGIQQKAAVTGYSPVHPPAV